jgi:aryl-alcohol dehydrogenase-like predicted oxidoreductase
MSFRQIEIRAFGRKLSNIMAHPASADVRPEEREFEEYFRLAGNCFHCHGEGGETRTKRAAGRWLRNRGLRGEFFVCTQICHEGWDGNNHRAIDRFTPEGVQEDIAENLELLSTDYFDLVYLDDNPNASLTSVVQAIGDEVKRGRLRAVGVRNWTAGRIAAAHSQLRSEGLAGIAAIVTTELSLASSTTPLWDGYLPFRGELSYIAKKLGLVVFAHAADLNLGQCLFGDADATSRMRIHWVERWNGSANEFLVRRVKRFADARGLTSRAVNVAWLLNMPFPCIAIVPLSPLLTFRRSEYESASLLRLEETDREYLAGQGTAT